MILNIICLCVLTFCAIVDWIIAIGANRLEGFVLAIIVHFLQAIFLIEIIKYRR